ncbi:MAG: septum formation initiator [Pseudonocardiaceae bacterium]
MTAPARTAKPAGGRASAPAHRRDTAPAHRRDTGEQRRRSPAVARAYARRAQRTTPRHGCPDSADAARTPFVMLVMSLLAMALVATLWLSTAATADSYHLESARKTVRNLTERSEGLSRAVATLETAPELARRARELGMVPAGDPARLIVRPDGTVTLVGEPRRAVPPAPPPAPAVAPAPPPAVPPTAAPVLPVPLVPAQPVPAQ